MRDGDWITDAVNAQVSSGRTELPLFHGTSLRLHALLQDPEFDVREVERLIATDPTLATALLRLANSSYYRGLEKTLTVHAAVMRLGAKEVANLVLMIGHSKAYQLLDRELRRYLKRLWRHAVGSALGSHWLSRKLGRPDLSTQAFLAGLLHDIGKLFVLRVLDDMEAAKRDALKAAAPELMASMHTEQGYTLLTRWNLPEVYCEIVRHHHDDCFDDGDTLALAVRLVDRVCNAGGIGLGAPQSMDLAGSPEALCLQVPQAWIEELSGRFEQALEIAA